MRVLVTGARGLLGGVLVSALAQNGYDVIATGRQPTGPAGRKISYRPADLTNADEVASLFRGEGPDAIIHAAARLRAEDEAMFARDNVNATTIVAEAAASHSAGPCIFFSTISVYSGDGPFVEGSPTEASEPYGRTKHEAELAWLNALGKRAIVLRLAGLHGHPRRTGFVFQVAAKALQSAQIELDEPDTQITPTFFDDVIATVSSILGSARHSPYRIFNLATVESQTYREVAVALCRLLHSDSRIVSKPGARKRNRVMDTTRIHAELGPLLMPLSAHLARMASKMIQAADCA